MTAGEVTSPDAGKQKKKGPAAATDQSAIPFGAMQSILTADQPQPSGQHTSNKQVPKAGGALATPTGSVGTPASSVNTAAAEEAAGDSAMKQSAQQLGRQLKKNSTGMASTKKASRLSKSSTQQVWVQAAVTEQKHFETVGRCMGRLLKLQASQQVRSVWLRRGP